MNLAVVVCFKDSLTKSKLHTWTFSKWYKARYKLISNEYGITFGNLKQGVQAQTVSNLYQAFANDLGNEAIRFILYVQEVVTHFIWLLHKIGHYFLDTQ